MSRVRVKFPKPERAAPQPKARIPRSRKEAQQRRRLLAPLRKSRPSPVRRTPRASLARQCAALWSKAVLRQGGCWLDGSTCSGPIDPAHVFPKGRARPSGTCRVRPAYLPRSPS